MSTTLTSRATPTRWRCSIDEFRYGVSDRGVSIRIPMATANAKAGYLEDRRPAANMDAYRVADVLLKTICG